MNNDNSTTVGSNNTGDGNGSGNGSENGNIVAVKASG